MTVRMWNLIAAAVVLAALVLVALVLLHVGPFHHAQTFYVKRGNPLAFFVKRGTPVT